MNFSSFLCFEFGGWGLGAGRSFELVGFGGFAGEDRGFKIDGWDQSAEVAEGGEFTAPYEKYGSSGAIGWSGWIIGVGFDVMHLCVC